MIYASFYFQHDDAYGDDKNGDEDDDNGDKA